MIKIIKQEVYINKVGYLRTVVSFLFIPIFIYYIDLDFLKEPIK